LTGLKKSGNIYKQPTYLKATKNGAVNRNFVENTTQETSRSDYNKVGNTTGKTSSPSNVSDRNVLSGHSSKKPSNSASENIIRNNNITNRERENSVKSSQHKRSNTNSSDGVACNITRDDSRPDKGQRSEEGLDLRRLSETDSDVVEDDLEYNNIGMGSK